MNEADRGAGARLTIDVGALVANHRRIADAVAPARAGAVVKADAYGLGVATIVPPLVAAGCRDVFVAVLAEAPPVRALLPAGAAVHVLNGLPPGAEAACVAIGAVPVCSTLDQLRRWAAEAHRQARRLPVALQIDSGMARLGLSEGEVAALCAEPALLQALDLTLVMSHLACADEPGSPINARQRAAFEALAARLPPAPRSLANSGGALLGRGFAHDVARPGIGLYGGNPGGWTPNPFAAVVRLDARVLQLRDVPAGTGVGYGLEGVADHPRRLATIGIGYADGWPRALKGRGAAWAGDIRLPLVGRVSMDSCIVDATALGRPGLAEGDWVELIGPHQPIDAVAEQAGTIAYELLTGLGGRFARVIVGTGDSVEHSDGSGVGE